METRALLTCLLAGAAGVLVEHAVAEEDAKTNAEEAIVVTATRTRRQQSQVPAGITIISKDEISASAAANPDDLFRALPGVSVMRGTGIGHGMPSRINIRGVPGSQRTLLLVDGMPLDEASTRFVSINEIPLQAIRQIEVIRGPFSNLYGTDAFGGVVNIITEPGRGKPSTGVFTEFGNAGFEEVGASHTGGKDNLVYSVTADQRSIDNYTARDYVIERRYDRGTQTYVETRKDALNYDYRDTRLLGGFTVDSEDESSLSTHWRYFESELGYGQKDMAPFYSTPEDNITKTRTALIGGSYATVFSPNLDLRFGGYIRSQKRQLWGLDFSHYDNEQSPVYVRSYSEHTCGEQQVDICVDLDLGSSQALLLGVDTRRTGVDFSPLQDNATAETFPGAAGARNHVWNLALYAQYEAHPGEKWKIISGARIDYHSEFGEAVSPRAGLSLDISERTTFRTSIGKAFRAPTLVELFQPALGFGYVTFESNPDLTPEHITAADMEIEHRLAETLTGRIAVFHNEMDDLIVNRAGGDVLTNVNIDEARSRGFETEAQWHVGEMADVSFSYTYQKSEDTQTGSGLDYVPQNTGSIVLRLCGKPGRWRVEGSVTELYTGERGFQDWTSSQWYPLDDYWRTDIAIKGTLDDVFWIGVGVQNATNERYQESMLATLAPARLVSFEVGTRY